MSACGLGCCEIVPMGLIDVFGFLVMILHVVHELMIWFLFWGCPVLRPSLECHHEG
jgi:hypothetical protein